MTKVDERSDVPELDEPARSRLADSLTQPGVVAASLLGSRARGEAGPLSDVDVGVWVDPELSTAERLRLRLALADAAAGALGTGELDVIVLNDASPPMRHAALRDGRRLLDLDPRQRVRLETRGLLDYLDTAPLRAQLSAARRRRVAEGRFGRR